MTSDILENQILQIYFVDLDGWGRIIDFNGIRIKDESKYAKRFVSNLNEKNEASKGSKYIPLVKEKYLNIQNFEIRGNQIFFFPNYADRDMKSEPNLEYFQIDLEDIHQCVQAFITAKQNNQPYHFNINIA